MIENSFEIVQVNYSGEFSGDAVLINIDQLRESYKYIGIWYARDGNEATSITTEVYTSSDEIPVKPPEFKFEIKENSFKQFNRKILPLEEKCMWITTRIDSGNYCKLRTGPVKEGKVYINYKMIHNKGGSFDILSTGTLKGGTGNYYGIYCEDNTGAADFNDLVMFFVALKELPPEDWMFDHYCIGIDGLPVITQPFRFSDNKKYSDWLGQNPQK
jgi:hypothetical protein